jgi:hypothetical protein
VTSIGVRALFADAGGFTTVRSVTTDSQPATTASAETSAFDYAHLTVRAMNVIAGIWGEEATRADLTEPDAHERLRRKIGVGSAIIERIDAAVVAWGLGGLGGKRAWDEAMRKHRQLRARTMSPARAGREALALVQEAIASKSPCSWCAAELTNARHADDCRASALIRAVRRRPR